MKRADGWVVQFLETYEGREPCVYKDSKGLWTIGIGILVDKRVPGAGLRDEEIEFIALNRVRLVKLELDDNLPFWKTLNEARQMVMVGMVFQMGMAGVLKFRRTLAAIRLGKFDDAADYMMDSKWAREDSPDRAADMARMMREGVFLA